MAGLQKTGNEAKVPIHVSLFIDTLDALQATSNSSELPQFLSWMRRNLSLVVQVVRYFCIMECRNKKHWKVTSHILPGSKCAEMWNHIVKHDMDVRLPFEGPAPRNGYSRKIVKDLKILGEFKDEDGTASECCCTLDSEQQSNTLWRQACPLVACLCLSFGQSPPFSVEEFG